MGANTFGKRFELTTFGESHGPAIGAVIDGCPAGIPFDEPFLRAELARRRPGQSESVSSRGERDIPEILSGVYQGQTLGTPIAILVRNEDARSSDYEGQAPRVGHADQAWLLKFGHTDPRGGGRSSGRETATRVMGGAVAAMVLKALYPELQIRTQMIQIGPLTDPTADQMAELLTAAKAEGKSYGGRVLLSVSGVPAGLGQPVFHKLKSDLASAMMGIGATSAIEIGEGFDATEAEGAQWHLSQDPENRYGGIQGGITTGAPIRLTLGFKPTSSVLDLAKKGRHDPCIVPRAVPVIEAMARLVLVDHVLWARTDRSAL